MVVSGEATSIAAGYTLSLHDALPIWMPDRTEANPNELNQDDARYGFRCCHLKNIWTAPLPPETEMAATETITSRSEERFSRNAETDLVCRLLLEKKKNLQRQNTRILD